MAKIGDDDKPVLQFKDKERGLVLNKTNAGILGAALGMETDNWIGREVILYSAKVNYQGNLVDGIRVDVSEPAPVPVPTVSEDDVPF